VFPEALYRALCFCRLLNHLFGLIENIHFFFSLTERCLTKIQTHKHMIRGPIKDWTPLIYRCLPGSFKCSFLNTLSQFRAKQFKLSPCDTRLLEWAGVKLVFGKIEQLRTIFFLRFFFLKHVVISVICFLLEIFAPDEVL